MIKTIYFHIGTVKTGSTLIQRMLWENRQLLSDFNTHYFDITPPKLSYPRYANAEFLVDVKSRVDDDTLESYIRAIDAESTIISEEGLWPNISLLKNPAFDHFEKKIIIYVRKPAEVIASWSAENAEPYNAYLESHVSGVGIVPVDKGIDRFTNEYKQTAIKFLEVIQDMNCEVIVRPYVRNNFLENDIFCDFLGLIGIQPASFFNHPDVKIVKSQNASNPRKFCDVSRVVWDALTEVGLEKLYNKTVVDYVYDQCIYGDTRSVLETLDDHTIERISESLKFFEDELSVRFLGERPVFENRMPAIYGKRRPPYQPVSKDEVFKLTYKFIIATRNTWRDKI